MTVTIGLDARSIYAKSRRGTGKNLLDVYSVMARKRPDWRFLMYHRGIGGDDPFADFDNVTNRQIDMLGDRWNLWEHFRLPAAAMGDRADLLHCPANSCPRFSRVPIVSTIHDLIPLKLAEEAMGYGQRANGDRNGFRSKVERCLKKSQRIIAVSQCTRNDLISDLNADPRRIDVITWAPDSRYAPVTDEAELSAVRVRYNIAGRYMLAFSGRCPRKNSDAMIRGFAKAQPAAGGAVQFILVGVEPAEHRQRLEKLIRRMDLGGRCAVFGFAAECDIAALLSGADALAFCSLYEGFGLPILDAFCCETAVLTSSVSSMPEVAGEAAVYCEPQSPESIAQGMKTILSDEVLRGDLVAKGRSRLREFTWEKTAESICRIFEKCLPARIES